MTSGVASGDQYSTAMLPETGAHPTVEQRLPIAGPIISVVVPALNEESVIGHCLESLVRQNLPSNAFEVLLVDNGSTDRTVDIALRFKQSVSLRVLRSPGARIGVLRNLGASAANGEFVAFLDADCVAPTHWLEQAISLLQADASAVIGAHYMIPRESSWVARAWYGDQHRLKSGLVSYLPGGNLLMSRKLFLKSGGFDETIDTNEDTEFCQRVSSLGTPIVGVASLSVIHLGTPQDLSMFFRKHRWHGNDVHRVFLRDIIHSRNRKSFFYALFVLVCEIGMLVGLSILIWTGNPRLLVACLSFLIAAPLLLATGKAVGQKRWGLLGPLTLLFLVYGLARAVCLLGMRATRTNTTRTPKEDASRVGHRSENPDSWSQ
jgi:glycosyltransferase involved in cell wall biosynthesis